MNSEELELIQKLKNIILDLSSRVEALEIGMTEDFLFQVPFLDLKQGESNAKGFDGERKIQPISEISESYITTQEIKEFKALKEEEIIKWLNE